MSGWESTQPHMITRMATCKNQAMETHNGKKSQTNHVQVNKMEIEILKTTASTKYLGRQLTFVDMHQTELDNRIGIA